MHPAVAAAMTTTTKTASATGADTAHGGHEEFPPPFPDLTRDEEKALFPPPYESTGASYWAFSPDIQPPASATQVRQSIALAQPSPGVGAYDVMRSERSAFQQSAAHSFRRAGLDDAMLQSPHGSTAAATAAPLSAGTPAKSRIHKTSLARSVLSPAAPASVNSQRAVASEPETNDDEDADRPRAPVSSARTSESAALTKPTRDALSDASGAGAPVIFSSAVADEEEEDDGDDDRLEVDILNALRRQHSMAVHDLMHDILQQTQPPAYSSSSGASPGPRRATAHRKVSTPVPAEASSPVHASKTRWASASSSTSRFVNRLRSREAVRLDDAPLSPSSSSTSRAPPQPQPKSQQRTRASTSYATPAPPRRKTPAAKPMKLPLPNGREPPSDEHVAWAARIGDFYRAKQSVCDDAHTAQANEIDRERAVLASHSEH